MSTLSALYEERKGEIQQRLEEFRTVQGEDIFYELCFCLLTPQTSGFRADACVQELKALDFLHRDVDVCSLLRRRVRFHNKKSTYLLMMKRQYPRLQQAIVTFDDPFVLRDFLLREVDGFGLKETHHFLRNIGYRDFAILDRHILKNLKRHKAIRTVPRSLTKKHYFLIERRFKAFATKINIPLDELDLLFWSMETGKVFK